MPIPLNQVNLSGASVGTSGKVDFTLNVPQYSSAHLYQQKQFAHIQVFNDSGSGLLLQFLPSTNSDYLPAGGWRTIVIEPDDTFFTWTVVYTLPNPPVSLLLPVYYTPGEIVPDVGQLGNSPVGIGGSVQTTSIQTLTNDGNAAGTQIIEAKQAGSSGSNVSVDNSGNVILQQFVSSVLTTIFQTIAGAATNASNVKLSDTNHQTEILGTLLADSHIIIPNATTMQAKDSGGTVRDILKLFSDNDLYLIATPANGNAKVSNSAQSAAIATFNDTAGLALNVGQFAPNMGALATVNGNVSGTVTLFTPIWGSALKVLIVSFNGFNDTLGFSTTLPSPAISRGFYACGNIGTATCGMWNNGVAQTLSQISAIGTGAGSSVGTTTAKANSIGQLVSGANQFNASNGNFGTTVFILIGV